MDSALPAEEGGILFDLPVYILITKQSINKEYLSIVCIIDIYFKLYYIRSFKLDFPTNIMCVRVYFYSGES